MEELFNLGLSTDTVKEMLEVNPNLKFLDIEEIVEKEKILEEVGCTTMEISNIISSNSLYLSRTKKEIFALINSLKNVGFENLDILFDANPYILNLEVLK